MPGKKGRKSGSRSNKQYTEKKRARQRKQRESDSIESQFVLENLISQMNASSPNKTRESGEEAAAVSSVLMKNYSQSKHDYDSNQDPDGSENKTKIQKPQKLNFGDEAAPGSAGAGDRAETSEGQQSDSDDDSCVCYCSRLKLTSGSAETNQNFVSGTRGNAGRAGHGRHDIGGRPVTLARRSPFSLNRGSRWNVHYRYYRKFYQNQTSPANPAPPIPNHAIPHYHDDDDEEDYPIINDNQN